MTGEFSGLSKAVSLKTAALTAARQLPCLHDIIGAR